MGVVVRKGKRWGREGRWRFKIIIKKEPLKNKKIQKHSKSMT